MRGFVLVGIVVGCGGHPAVTPAPAVASNPAREVLDTRLTFDVTAHTGTATVTFAPSAQPGATLEIGDLAIDHADVAYRAGKQLDLALPASDRPAAVTIAFHYQLHDDRLAGAATAGFTMLWPYHCGDLFPCHSSPADGTTFSSLTLTGVPAGRTAVYPRAITAEAPAYQLAWAIDAYTELPLGATTAGTQVTIAYRPGELAAAQRGGAHLVAAFDWLEKTLGPYRFGAVVGSVSVAWPRGAFGGMEHHPRWHVASAALGDEVTHVHEAAHGWFGDGVRLACWEDFVLSEGTATYLAGRALDVVAPAAGAAAWQAYATELAGVEGTKPVWPDSCGAVDVMALFTDAPYMRGAFFYRAVALKVGAAALDRALAAFYNAHAGRSARMRDVLATIRDVTGYDASPCAETWLRATTTPAPAACP